MTQDELKQAVAEAALAYIRPKLENDTVVGIGTGSTANMFIDCLGAIKGEVNATVASSEASAQRLKSHGIPVYDLNTVDQVDFYIDGADESKLVHTLGAFPLPVEVIPMARSHVARELVKLGGDPVYRDGVVTDNGNIILDIHNLEIMEPSKLETELNQITGVVTNGLFARRPADVLILGTEHGPETLE